MSSPDILACVPLPSLQELLQVAYIYVSYTFQLLMIHVSLSGSLICYACTRGRSNLIVLS